jgi:hypothetical protein
VRDLCGTLPTNYEARYVTGPLDGITGVTLHFTAGPEGHTAQDVAAFQTSKAARGQTGNHTPFPAIAYTFLIDGDGTANLCHDLEVRTWHSAAVVGGLARVVTSPTSASAILATSSRTPRSSAAWPRRSAGARRGWGGRSPSRATVTPRSPPPAPGSGGTPGSPPSRRSWAAPRPPREGPVQWLLHRSGLSGLPARPPGMGQGPHERTAHGGRLRVDHPTPSAPRAACWSTASGSTRCGRWTGTRAGQDQAAQFVQALSGLAEARAPAHAHTPVSVRTERRCGHMHSSSQRAAAN